MKHKYANLIHAWADGAEIQVSHIGSGEWVDVRYPLWHTEIYEFRIKPERKPDKAFYIGLSLNFADSGFEYDTVKSTIWHDTRIGTNLNLKCTFDGETGKLKGAEVL
jgi:hypothetical protein